MVIHPIKLFGYALAFRFSSGRGRCFSPGIKALSVWYFARLRLRLVDKSRLKWMRGWLEWNA